MGGSGWSMKSSATSFAIRTGRNGPHLGSGSRPRMAATNSADSCWSRTCTIVWFSSTAMVPHPLPRRSTIASLASGRGEGFNLDMTSTASGPEAGERQDRAVTFLAAVLVGAAVSLLLGVYGREHDPAGQALFTLGFSGTLNMKAWLATVVLAGAVAQVVLALWLYGRFGGSAPPWVGPAHRLVGLLTFMVSLPVAYHCLWSLGFETDAGQTRRFVHSVLGCSFYGAFAMKTVCVRSTRMPGWALPVVGGAVFAILVGLWLTSSLWFFQNSGFPSF